METLELQDKPMLCSGHAACPGCVEAMSVRHVLATMGPDTMAVIPPSCMAIIAGPQPMSRIRRRSRGRIRSKLSSRSRKESADHS